ncbi:MAG: hypothetical protein K2X93_16375 [Candidatus Obscuribacterales bacterium]|nr:hypothetical protein [Candidatus Obscuribacterales bacterium]
MNTLHKEQLEKLERMLDGPASQAADQNNNSGAKDNSLLYIRMLSLTAIGFAAFTVFYSQGYNLLVCATLLMTLGVLYMVVKRKELRIRGMSGLKAWLPEGNTFKILGTLAVFGVGYVAAIAPQEIEKLKNSTPQLSNSLPNLSFSHTNSDAFAPDAHLGTTEVGPKISGLSLEKSLITGHVDANSLTSALYWNITFNNTNGSPQEARARLVLPEGATVSRATLWVNGVAQEAAFDATSKVQSAYQWIVQRGRDPLLITQTEEGEVFVQAYPVPAHGTMQLRIGITAPLQAQSRTDFELMAPHIVSSNFELKDLVSAVKLESNAKIDSNLDGEKVKDRRAKSILTMDLKSSDQENAKFAIHRARPFELFATRATHSAERSFIVERLIETNSGNLELTTEKTQALPTVQVAYDFPTASRVSTLWAMQEAQKCVDNGDTVTAGQLGAAYRIVTAATGATVLESQSDYDHNGLDRNFYRVVSANTAQNYTGSQTQQFAAGSAPALQGATNGTIGPQGADATSIMGVNSAGTVRVNNLANAEWLVNQMGLCLTWFFLGVAAIFLGKSFTGNALSKSKNTIAGASALMIALTVTCTLSWLISSLRDANFFS